MLQSPVKGKYRIDMKKPFKISLLVLAIGTAGIVLSACSQYGSQSTSPQTNQNALTNTPSPAASNAVTIQNMAFSSQNLQVKVGQAVTWTNQDAVGHSATADDNSFDTGVLSQGQSKSITFAKAGTFSYCSVHPGMKATITVTQ